MGSMTRVAIRNFAGSVIGGLALLAAVGTLWAHAVVVPAVSSPGSYETYTLRVPNEKDVATTRVEIRFPPKVFVVSFAEVPGWALEVRRDSTGRATGGVWTGSLEPGRFVELPFVAVNPSEAATLVWVVDQTYGTGEVVSWAGEPDAEFPASRTSVESASVDADEGALTATRLSWIALLLSAAALLLALKAVFLRAG